jgi:IS4 transposase
MKHINTVLHGLLKHISKPKFDKAVERHNGDYRARKLFCWTQFVSLLYAQLANRQSLRDLTLAFNSQSSFHYHLGVKRIKRSTLAEANESRPVAIYEELFYSMLEKVRTSVASEAKKVIRLIDSTTISLNQQQFKWAKFRTHQNGMKLHFVYDPTTKSPTFFSMTPAKVNDCKAARYIPLIKGATYVFDRAYNYYKWYYESLHLNGNRFIGRMKKNTRYDVTKEREVEGNIIADQEILLSSKKGENCPITLRRIHFIRSEDDKEIVLISNDLERSAQEIMGLYKQRWEIELFFKWIKQNLRLKRFLGTSENAVKIQVLVAMIAYLLLRFVKNSLPLKKLSLQEIYRLISANIFHRRELNELLLGVHEKVQPDKSTGCKQTSLMFA